jgi:hypothetical protein
LIETSYGAVHAQLQLIEWKKHDEQPNNDQVEIQWKIKVLFLIYHGAMIASMLFSTQRK